MESLNFANLRISRRQVNIFMGIDTSYSMSETHQVGFRSVSRQSVANKGGCAVVDALTNGDSITAFAFNNDVHLLTNESLQPISDSTKATIKRKINNLRPSGGTKFNDTLIAMAQAILPLAAAANVVGDAISEDLGVFRLVILTDGEDTTSKASKQDALRVVQQIAASFGPEVMKITFIGVQVNSTTRAVLEELTRAAGPMATFHDARDMNQVTQAFQEFTLELQTARIISVGASTPRSRLISDDDSEWPGLIQKGSHVRCIGQSRGAGRVDIGDVGVVKGRDKDAEYVVDFPAQDEWVGRSRDLELDKIAEAVRPGALVALKEGTSPRDRFQHGMHGLVVKVEHDGIVFVQLGFEPEGSPSANLWKGRLQELKVYDNGRFANGRGWWPGQIQLGQAVRAVDSPSTGMGSLRPGEVGYVRARARDHSHYVCDFPSADGWKGRPSDLYVDSIATKIRPGTKVSVRENATPKYQWGSVRPGQVGTVVSIGYDGDGCIVRFPQCRNWRCLLSELQCSDSEADDQTTQGHSKEETREQTFPDNCVVVIRGLNSPTGAPFNGKMAKVINLDVSNGRYRVIMLDDDSGDVKSFKEQNLMHPRQKHPTGTSVRLRGIEAQGGILNGKYASITGFDRNSGRYIVELWEGKQQYRLLPTKFEFLSRIEEID